MTRVPVKNMPRLHLSNLLRRRKITLATFVEQGGIQTYSTLVAQCGKMGVQPPSLEEYERVFPDKVTSPAEGVVVVEPMDVVRDLSGKIVESTLAFDSDGDGDGDSEDDKSDMTTGPRPRRRRRSSKGGATD